MRFGLSGSKPVRSRNRAAGFTLTELVVVMVIAGILSVFAISRINTQSFDTEGFANRAVAMVRYAQRIAVSQRRTVVVRVCLVSEASSVFCPDPAGQVSLDPAANGLVLCYTDVLCSGGAVREPPGAGVFTHRVPSGVSIAGSNFSFSALGRPSAGGTLTVSGDIARTITIEAETGYVH